MPSAPRSSVLEGGARILREWSDEYIPRQTYQINRRVSHRLTLDGDDDTMSEDLRRRRRVSESPGVKLVKEGSALLCRRKTYGMSFTT